MECIYVHGHKSNVNSLFNQYEAARSSTEKEEKKLLQQQGYMYCIIVLLI